MTLLDVIFPLDTVIGIRYTVSITEHHQILQEA